MKKSEITNELKTFLKKEGCYDEYMQCFDEGFHGDQIANEINFIGYAFNWECGGGASALAGTNHVLMK